MKKSFSSRSILTSLILILILSPVNIFASDGKASIMVNNNADIFNNSGYMYLAAADVPVVSGTNDKSSESNNNFQINWHKVLGYTTIGMMGVTITAGFVMPRKGHCAIAGVTTGLAVATVADGIYQYGGLISITDGDWKYNTHAILGTLATAGFITTLALADGEPHIATGIASAAAFTVALAVIYF